MRLFVECLVMCGCLDLFISYWISVTPSKLLKNIWWLINSFYCSQFNLHSMNRSILWKQKVVWLILRFYHLLSIRLLHFYRSFKSKWEEKLEFNYYTPNAWATIIKWIKKDSIETTEKEEENENKRKTINICIDETEI